MRGVGYQAWLIGVAVLAALAGTAWVFAIDPAGSPWFPRCPLYWLTGLYCPGCGTLRAAHALLHGRLADALTFNPLFVGGAPLLAGVWIWNRCRPPSQRFVPRPVWAWWLLALVVAFGVARNVPVYPCTLLAPHARAE